MEAFDQVNHHNYFSKINESIFLLLNGQLYQNVEEHSP
jgi:hypothetical protein